MGGVGGGEVIMGSSAFQCFQYFFLTYWLLKVPNIGLINLLLLNSFGRKCPAKFSYKISLQT